MRNVGEVLRTGLIVAGLAWSGSVMAAGIEMSEYSVPSDPGIQLYVREKHPAGGERFGTDRIQLPAARSWPG